MTETSFDSAVAALYSSEHQASTAEALALTAQRRTQTISDMRIYMQRVGLLQNGKALLFQNKRLIHITGTKGKGSTACLCETIIRQAYGLRTGLFTSPHLVDIRERIRVNGQPVSTEVFGKAYWTLRQKLEAHAGNEQDALPTLPGYFRMLTLMALYIFSHYEPPIDVVILEVGMGGRFDATNSLDLDTWKSYACGITKLDYDHVRVLGHRLEQIAWEKAGIFLKNKLSPGTVRPPDDAGDESAEASASKMQKSTSVKDGCSYFALDPKKASVQHVLEECALGEKLCFVAGSYERELPPEAPIGLAGNHQRDNAELAMALCQAVCDDKSVSSTQVHAALAQAKWLGRCQTIVLEPKLNIRLDGAHTVESVHVGLEWFDQVAEQGAQRHLIFNCSHERNPVELLERFVPLGFHSVSFCKADSERPSAIQKPSAKALLQTWRSSKPKSDDSNGDDSQYSHLPDQPEATWQETLCNIWCVLERELLLNSNKAVASGTMSLSASLDRIRQSLNEDEGASGEVLIAGSLYLVGSALSALSWKETDAEGTLMANESS
ncbi:folylpolyglutamate synthase [Fistulifera solaris]|uniref:tetrahydrofolate synthase n=1 Tax=Fistulifera solaris TaxID=1519565 RepID=A0A1Z5KHW9_FISSO|nr:folylpolyglutamate synthase [Fistulifera solaris]|eukprot:GAX25715.1 folylpolyglutamate synthase [Fistulifera solaris]